MNLIFNYLYVIGAVLLLFGAAIFVHEFGHYWMARRRGLKVEAFAIGFGPKIFGWTRDGIEYSWRWIPAGGYVKLPQMIMADAIEGKREGAPLPPVSPWSKILVAFAGPFMNIVFAFAIAAFIYVVGLPIAHNPSIIGYVEPNSDEARCGLREGDSVVSVDGKRVKSWEDVQSTTILARTNVLAVVTERDGLRYTNQLRAKVSDVFGLKMLNLDPKDHPVINEVTSGGAAEAGGLLKGDEIVSVGDIPVAGQNQFIELIKKRGGVATEIVVKRKVERLVLKVTPRLDEKEKVGRIGAIIGSSSTVVYRVMKPGPTPWAQVADVFNKTIATFSALFHSKQTGVGAKDLSGPIGIFAILAAQVNADYRLALSFLVLLNVNLAILNLLPVPVLDGGHILMALVERVRRRPLDR